MFIRKEVSIWIQENKGQFFTHPEIALLCLINKSFWQWKDYRPCLWRRRIFDKLHQLNENIQLYGWDREKYTSAISNIPTAKIFT